MNRAVLAVLDLIVEFDEFDTRLRNSAADMPQWLAFDLGLGPSTARAWTRIAHALAGLPAIREPYASGSVSLDELQILCRYATPETELDLLALTREFMADELVAAIRRHLDVETAPRRRRSADSPWLEMTWSEDESHLRLRGEIPGVDGLMVETALRRVATRAPLDESTGLHRHSEVANGEALIQIASEAAADDRDHDRATLVVHFNAAELASGRTSGLIGEQVIDREELLRLGCDARIQPAIDDPSGVTVGVGRTTRTIPGWLRRLVDGRDGGCRFPACSRTRWTHVHHLVHWAEGGPTNLDNLLTLCGFHHRLIHRKGWELRGNPNREVTFMNQWGVPHQPARRRFSPTHVEELLGYLDYYHDFRLGRLATATGPP